MNPEARHLVAALEALLFAAGEPLPAARIAAILGCPEGEVAQLAEALEATLAERGLQVVKLAGGYGLATRSEYADYVEALVEPEPQSLSVQALEALAIIAYRQPITRPEVDELRGVNSAGVITTLLEKNLIRIAGRKSAPGRPFLLETSEQFLSLFGLNELSDLPLIEQFEAAGGPAVQPTLNATGALADETANPEGEESSTRSAD